MGKELIEHIYTDFDDHLSTDTNKRIIFSGKFGSGKTFFLKHFFENDTYKEKYTTLFLNPVNYSIAQNEDIFELIKVDILFNILKDNLVDFEKFEFSTGLHLWNYSINNSPISTILDKLGSISDSILNDDSKTFIKFWKGLKTIFDLGNKIKEDFEKSKKEVEENQYFKEINTFLQGQLNKKGSYFEDNLITTIILNLIEQLKENTSEKTKKETVLVIDDLDRVDPEHIFRILNVLSAHERDDKNKFGFDKIILVCDLDNIEYIFYHKYGLKTDFSGYIDKFYSNSPYKFTNHRIFELINFDSLYQKNTFPYFSQIREKNIIIKLIQLGLKENYLPIRNILKLESKLSNLNKSVIRNHYYEAYINGKNIKQFKFLFSNVYESLEYLIQIFDNITNLESFLNKINKYDGIFTYQNLNNYIGFNLLIHNTYFELNKEYFYKLNNSKITLTLISKQEFNVSNEEDIRSLYINILIQSIEIFKKITIITN